MPRQRKQHLNQRQRRRRSYSQSGTGGEKYRPGFPMNLFQRSNWFWGLGLIGMVGGLLVAFVAGSAISNDPNQVDVPTLTPTAETTGTPGTGTPDDADATPTVRAQFSAAAQVLVPTSDYTATIATSRGDIEVEFFVEEAPNTVNSFIFLAGEGFFDGQVIHRVEPGFVVQAGDPDGINGNGFDGPGYQTADEPNEIRNERGTIAMAKTPGSSVFGSQFFINLDDNPTLDYDNPSANKFYPFARVTSGMDVVDQIEVGDVIESITVVEHPDPNAPTPTPSPEPSATGSPESTTSPEAGEATATPAE